jgi:microcompartment protein CcmK/EutM
MILGTVTGTIHSTIAHEFYRAKKLLIVEREDGRLRPTGTYLIAIDAVGAGVGERVLVLDEGNGARQVTGSADAPVRSVVVGIVDEVETT